MSDKIEVHKLTNDPTSAWQDISKNQKVIKVNVKIPTTAKKENFLRVVCMSDTHSLEHLIKFDIPEGDIFIHAGDFTRCGSFTEVQQFNSWLGKLPHKYKIVIAGNHELSFDPNFINHFENSDSSTDRSTHTGGSFIFGDKKEIPTLGIPKDDILEAIKNKVSDIKSLLTNCIYLEDSLIDIQGVKIFGTPWQPEFCHWAFNIPRGEECLKKWNDIPNDIDILITHTPPVGHGDLCCSGVRAGCVELLQTIQNRVKPKYHIFGHVHEGYGVTSDGKIIFINASICDINYLPNNLPIVFDIKIK